MWQCCSTYLHKCNRHSAVSFCRLGMYHTENSSSWNLTRAEKRVFSQTPPSFMEIALLVLSFRSVVTKLTRQTLYNCKALYSETIFKEANTREDGEEIGHKCISNICYTDDPVLISNSLGGLQYMVLWGARVSHKHGLKINKVKQNAWSYMKRGTPNRLKMITLNKEQRNSVDKFLHRGTWFQEETDTHKDQDKNW